mmetsp:Transcript_2112/g.4284  ORF Transcript_2112/g.4284 Transcript_2112/m.4284 type:complete len:86 (+) Transcript_2112:124-381(+)
MVKRSKAALEVYKFALYISIPITMTFGLVFNPERMEYVTNAFGYVVYPPEGPKPPTMDELKVIVAEKKQVEMRAEQSKSWWSFGK